LIAQDENKFKTLKKYELILRTDTFVGVYIGEIDRLTIEGEKQKSPMGHGFFVGSTDKNKKYVVCKGNWYSGSLYGKSQVSFFANDYYPNLVLDSLDNPKRMSSKKELWSTLNLDSLVIEAFNGEFLKNNLENGTGCINNSNYQYKGQISNWRPHGKGKISFIQDTLKLAEIPFYHPSFEGNFLFGQLADGAMSFSNHAQQSMIQSLSGNWKENLYTGIGKVLFPDGSTYEGEWSESSLQGKGKFIRKDGYEFTGDFVQNQCNGAGSISAPNYLYTGDITNWIPNGKGSMSFLRDTVYLADIPFLNPKFEGLLIQGELANGKMSFDRFSNKFKKTETQTLVGNWKNKQYTGNGKVALSDSTIYEGSWKNGELNGQGKFSHTKGLEFIGDFTKNEMNGNGKINAPDFIYTGEIKAWKPNGKGSMSFLNDTIFLAGIPFYKPSFEGQLINGELSVGKLSFEKNGVQSLTGDWTNKVFNGKGRLVLYDEIIYDGDWVNSEMDGKGTYQKLNSYVYEGEVKKNKFQGKGTMKYSNGWVYEANWSNGNLSGNCKKTSPKGLITDGIVEGDKYTATGQIEFIDELIFDGTFTKEGNKFKDGSGKIKYPNGDILVTTLKDNQYYSKGRRNIGFFDQRDSLYEEGNFINGKLNGHGKMTFVHLTDSNDPLSKSVALYEGNFKDGLFEGNGTVTVSYDGTQWKIEAAFKNGNSVQGKVTISSFHDEMDNYVTNYQGALSGIGIPTGQGKMTDSEQYAYEGTFQNGLLNGKGKITYPDGKIYQGEVINNQPQGKGSMTLNNSQVISGNFKDGEYQKPFQCESITIGTQVWMAENLNVTVFRNGDPIYEAKSKEEWYNAGEQKKPAFCYFNNDPTSVSKYGILYNWYAVIDPRGLAPEGWRVPSHTDAELLRDFLSSEIIAKQKSIEKDEANGINTEKKQIELNRLFRTCQHALNCDDKLLSTYEKGAKYFMTNSDKYFRDYDGDFKEAYVYSDTKVAESQYWTISYNGENGCIMHFDTQGLLNSGDNTQLDNGYWGNHWLVYSNSRDNKSKGYHVRCLK